MTGKLHPEESLGPGDDPDYQFENALRKESMALDSGLQDVIITEDVEDYSFEDLVKLRLDQITSTQLERNQLFTILRGKLVNFYKRWEQFRNSGETSVMGKNLGITHEEKIETIGLKKTLKDSLKRLLRAVILTHDPIMQAHHLKRLYDWH